MWMGGWDLDSYFVLFVLYAATDTTVTGCLCLLHTLVLQLLQCDRILGILTLFPLNLLFPLYQLAGNLQEQLLDA